MTYNASMSDGTTGAFATIQTGTGTLVSVPVGLGTSRREAETLVGTTAVRYGLTSRSELFARGSAVYTHTRTTDGITGLTTAVDDARFLRVVAGVNYQFLEEGKRPGLVGFADVALSENVAFTGSEFVFARSGMVGLTAYKVIDPVVLSLTGGWRPAFSRDVSGIRVDPRDILFLAPALSFAVNNEVTLIGRAFRALRRRRRGWRDHAGSETDAGGYGISVGLCVESKRDVTHECPNGCYW